MSIHLCGRGFFLIVEKVQIREFLLAGPLFGQIVNSFYSLPTEAVKVLEFFAKK